MFLVSVKTSLGLLKGELKPKFQTRFCYLYLIIILYERMLAIFFPLKQFFSCQKSKVFSAYLDLVRRLGKLVSAVRIEVYDMGKKVNSKRAQPRSQGLLRFQDGGAEKTLAHTVMPPAKYSTNRGVFCHVIHNRISFSLHFDQRFQESKMAEDV